MKVLLSWSSGKDSAWTLYTLQKTPGVEIVGLLTTINQAASRVAMHAVREELLEAQAAAAGVQLWKVYIPSPCSNEIYESAMAGAMERAKREKVDAVAFGDLYLSDIRKYREEKLAPTGIKPIFPIWGIPTKDLSLQMIDAGLRARLTCVDPRVLNKSFCGREFDRELLKNLPQAVDPCGENGEFHTFCYAGPMYQKPIAIKTGETIERDGFVFTDIRCARGDKPGGLL